MSEDVQPLAAAVRQLASDLPPGLRRVSVRLGEAELEVEWSATAQERAELTVPASWTEPDESTSRVLAPTVGTFYHRPEPGSPPFVTAGQEVQPDTVIGIVEAMKLMNKITADCAGTVREVLVPDGTAVEYGQALVEISLH